MILRRRKEKKEIFKDKNGNRISSSLEEFIAKILDSLGYCYKREWRAKYKNRNKFYDFFIWKEDEFGVLWSFLIEAHGDFFHSRNYFFGSKKKEKLYRMQRSNIINDRIKNKIANELQIPILYIWESEKSIAKIKIEKTISLLETGKRDLSLIGEEFYMNRPRRSWK